MRGSLRRKWYVSGLGLLLIISLSLLFMSGCSKNTVSNKTDDVVQEKVDWLTTEYNDPDNIKSSPIFPLTDTVLSFEVTAQGGQGDLVIGENKLSFVVPAGALSASESITIDAKLIQTPFGAMWMLDCGPDGTVFAKALQVKVTWKSFKLVTALFYFNERRGRWEVQQVAPVVGGSANLNIYHFSRYGIS